MESEKHTKSDSSSEESDRLEQVKDDGGTKRSYECTYCKRGFTNAQALGGHMNIHRKDRAKAKQLPGSSTLSKSDDGYVTPTYFAPISGEPEKYYAPLEAQRSYQMYFPLSAPGPNYPHACHGSDFPVATNSEHLSLNEERLGSNLTLRIGPKYVDGGEEKREHEEKDEVDLELRLGPDP